MPPPCLLAKGSFWVCARAGKRVLKKEQRVPGGYDKAAYRAFRLYATAPDGVRVLHLLPRIYCAPLAAVSDTGAS